MVFCRILCCSFEKKWAINCIRGEKNTNISFIQHMYMFICIHKGVGARDANNTSKKATYTWQELEFWSESNFVWNWFLSESNFVWSRLLSKSDFCLNPSFFFFCQKPTSDVSPFARFISSLIPSEPHIKVLISVTNEIFGTHFPILCNSTTLTFGSLHAYSSHSSSILRQREKCKRGF